MSDREERLEEMVSSLKQIRDELKVQIHLGKAEAKDEWEEMEGHWEHLESRMKRVGDAAADAGDDVAAAGKQLAEEIGNAYKRIRKSLD